MKGKSILKSFQTRSKSNPSLVHTTLVYQDGTMSCNCPGWIRHVQADGTRHCRHLDGAINGSMGEVPAQVIKAQSLKHIAPAKPAKVILRRFNFED